MFNNNSLIQECYAFRSTTKNNEVTAEKNVSEQWGHQALVDARPSWIDARRQQYIILVNFKLTVDSFLS